MVTCIDAQGIRKSFKDFQLKDVSFTLEQGTIMGFIGENGAGKSTTIKCLLNLLKIDAGSIHIFGLEHSKYEHDIKKEIGVVFDDLHFPEMLNATQINQFLKKVYDDWDENYYFQLLTQFKVPVKKTVKELSRGMKMKLSLAIALSHHPKLLILDEPTSGLDPIVRDEILDLFLDFMQDENHSILFSSHITSDLEKIADSITFIHEGKVLFSEDKNSLLENYAIWKGSEKELIDIPNEAIISIRKHAFGVEALVKRDLVNNGLRLEQPSIEEIMVYFARGKK